MTDRIPLDHLTSDDLDQLYDQLDNLRRLHLTTLGTLGIAAHRLDRIRDAAHLHRQALIGTNELYAVIEADDTPASAATQATEPATITDPAWLRQQYAAALYERERPPRAPAWADAYPVDREVFEAMADAVLRVRDRHLDQLRQRLELAAEWTPPPPGSTREQLPETMLNLIRDRLPDYLSTACRTADTLACAACYPGSGAPRPQYDEIREHAERLHQRCRLNNKFTGQLCTCGCHPTKEQS